MDRRWQDLHQLAHRQRGHITTRQAEDVGLTRAALHYHLAEGNIVRRARGVYRLTIIPPSENEREAVLILWSADRSGRPQATLSHETALRHYGLSDAFPSKLHLTVPTSFRKRPPGDVTLHRADLADEDVRREDVLRFTTPARTILDLARDDYPVEQLQDAYGQAVQRGMIRRHALQGPDPRALDAYLERLPSHARDPLRARMRWISQGP